MGVFLMLSVYSSSLYEHRKWGIFSAISGYFYYASHRKEDFAMKKVLNRLRDRWRPATYFFIEDEEGVGVVEIILILVENSTTQNPCVLC